MKRILLSLIFIGVMLAWLEGCKSGSADLNAEAPPPATVVPAPNANLVIVDHPELFPTVAATDLKAPSRLVVTGNVMPDVDRNVPVVSLASGKVMSINARLGDTVQKGQLLLTVRSDEVAGGFSDYRKAVADEALARAQLERSKDLYEHGAVALNDLQVAQDAEDKAKVDVETTAEHLRLLGNDPNKPAHMVDLVAPVSGVITDQEVTNASAVQAFNTPAPFTISDLSSVWVVCDVYENDLSEVHVGDTAEITLNAYPDHKIKGTVSNIGAILDPNLRTAKVRIEVRNPGMMRLGMFATATFLGRKIEIHAVIPATAILHLHDREWVYTPQGGGRFKRLEVVSGASLPGNMQEILSGIKPGDAVVSNALPLQNTVEQ